MNNKKTNTIVIKKATSLRKAFLAFAVLSMFLTGMVFPASDKGQTSMLDLLNIKSPDFNKQFFDMNNEEQLVKALIDTTENVLDDWMDLYGVNSTKAKIVASFKRRGPMTGKSDQQIVDLFLADVRSHVTDAKILAQMSEDFAKVIKYRATGNNSAPVKGTNVTKVSVGDGNRVLAVFIQVAPKVWNHYYPDEKRLFATHRETGRDEWSVYLSGPKIKFISLDLWKKVATYKNPGTTNTYQIMASSNDPIKTVADNTPKPTATPNSNSTKKTNVTKVSVGDGNQVLAVFIQVAPNVWNHYYPDEKRIFATHRETGRDEWSVYLSGPKVKYISLDLRNKVATYKNPGKSNTLKIMASNNTPIKTVADNKPKPTPKPAPKPTPKPVPKPTPKPAPKPTNPNVKEVKFYQKNFITMNDAQRIAAQNGWEIATPNQVIQAWNSLGLHSFAYGMTSNGSFCVPIQQPLSSFNKGHNCGAVGGNQGFLYVVKSSSTPPVVTPPRRSASTGTVDDYIRSLNYDRDRLLAVQPDAGPPKTLGRPEDAGVDEPNVVCTRTKKKLAKNFDTLQLLNPNEGIIYPGATLFADSRLSDGTPGSITLKRAPLKLRVNNLDGLENENILINDPNSQKVAGAINQNINLWFRKYPGRRNVKQESIEYFDAYSKDQVAMNLDFKAEWLNGSASALFNFNSNEEKTILFVYARNVFYSVTAELPRTPGAFFDASVTQAQARQTFNNQRPPAFVQKVDYGRLILFRLETKKGVTTADLKAAFAQKAGDNKVDVKAGVDYEKIRRETSIKYVRVGGSEADDAPIPTNFEQLKPLLEQGRNFSISNPAAPLNYTIRFLDNEGYNIAKMGDSTEYVETNCKIVAQKYFKVQHRGVYISEVKVTYLDGNKRLVTHPSSRTGRTAGLDDLFNIPGNATKVRLFIRMNTGVGLVTLIDRYLTGQEQDNMCFRTVGTTIIGRDLKIEPCNAEPRNPIR